MLDIFDVDPGDLAHGLAFDGHHGVGQLPDHLLLLLGRKYILDDFYVDDRHGLVSSGFGFPKAIFASGVT